MPDTPTPASALTDEQIEDLRIEIVETGAGLALRQARLTRYTAAVVERAKREAAEEIAQAIDRLHDIVYQARRVPELDPLRVDTACQAYRDGAAIARQIGANQ